MIYLQLIKKKGFPHGAGIKTGTGQCINQVWIIQVYFVRFVHLPDSMGI